MRAATSRHSSGALSSTQSKPRSAICRYGIKARVGRPRVSYRETVGYADTERPEYKDNLSFVPAHDVSHVSGVGMPTAFNLVNSGTCEKNQRAYFDACVRPRRYRTTLRP